MTTWSPGVGSDVDGTNLVKFDFDLQQNLTAFTVGAVTVRTAEAFAGPLARRKLGNTFAFNVQLMAGWPTSGLDSHIAPSFGAFSFPDGWRGRPYFAQLDMTLADQPITFEITDGSLPVGLELISTDGHSMSIEGTPTESGTFAFDLTATSAYGESTVAFSIVIADAVLPPAGNGQIFPPAVNP